MYAQATTRNDDFKALVRGHYGLPSKRRPAAPRPAPNAGQHAPAVVLSADTGTDVLEPGAGGEAPFEEYVVDRPEPPWPPQDVVAAPSAPGESVPAPASGGTPETGALPAPPAPP